MQTQTFEWVIRQTLDALTSAVGDIRQIQEATISERVRLLAAAFEQQTDDIRLTVQRMVDKQSSRALQRRFNLDDGLRYVALSDDADSQTMTFWLLELLKLHQGQYEQLVQRGRLGAARGAILEITALLTAQRKRIAIEAHRFSDL